MIEDQNKEHLDKIFENPLEPILLYEEDDSDEDTAAGHNHHHNHFDPP